jgi:hypothetical protein
VYRGHGYDISNEGEVIPHERSDWEEALEDVIVAFTLPKHRSLYGKYIQSQGRRIFKAKNILRREKLADIAAYWRAKSSLGRQT